MKAQSLLWTLLFGASCSLLGATAVAQEKKDEKKAEPAKPAAAAPAPAKPADKPAAVVPPEMEAYIKAATPGEFHAKLKPFEGNWDAVVKVYMDPSGPTESKGTCSRKWLLDGRFMQEDYSGDMMGMPFKGIGILGYDNVLKKYVSTWIDTMGTGLMVSTGTVDASGKVFTYEGEHADAMTGQMTKSKLVTKVIDDKKHTFEMSGPGPDGKDMKMMEITYTKK